MRCRKDKVCLGVAIMCVLTVLMAGCTDKPAEVPAKSQSQEDAPPVLEQNLLYKTNRSKSLRPKDTSFQESPDDFKEASKSKLSETASD